uniref:Putative secreted peptide n=1 Tax=Anopheles braziliensis TaxID=58242 RepID=A0A2M3ZEM8_9DIPT
MYSLKRFLCALLAIVVLLFQLSSVESAPYNDILQPLSTNAPSSSASRQTVKNLFRRVIVGDSSSNSNSASNDDSSEEQQPYRQRQRY